MADKEAVDLRLALFGPAVAGADLGDKLARTHGFKKRGQSLRELLACGSDFGTDQEAKANRNDYQNDVYAGNGLDAAFAASGTSPRAVQQSKRKERRKERVSGLRERRAEEQNGGEDQRREEAAGRPGIPKLTEHESASVCNQMRKAKRRWRQ